MQRRRASSAKQKKAKLLLKRAVKRGDVSPPPPPKHKYNFRTKSQADAAANQSQHAVAVTESARRLQSSFVKLPKEFLQDTRRLAASIPLPRPISSDAASWRDAVSSPEGASTNEENKWIEQLTCPKRPKWRYDMTKNEVEKNEEQSFKKWLDQTDALIGDWNNTSISKLNEDDHDEKMPSAPTSFERNLEVWRQLWRVTEISQILLILLDSRCPLVHYPPSLAAYLAAPHLARKRTILVLTKVDIAGPSRVDAWTRYLNARFPDLPVVPVEAYSEKSAGEGAGSRKMYQPFLPSAFRQKLVDTLRDTHASLLVPPEKIRDNPEKVKNWKPSVKRDVDWARVLTAQGGQVGAVVNGAVDPHPKDTGKNPEDADDETPDGNESADEADPEFLTIGLIGQPNVGKSSLLNALFGTSKVRTSKTPGKTRHFQTLFWTPDVRLVDCPGLVMPNLIPMETQVLAGVLPISRVSAIPLCIHHVARLLPLEVIFGLEHPSQPSEPVPDKRTWRVPKVVEPASAKVPPWTAMDIMMAFALKKGWLTAQAGRPDIARAGNAILRAVAEGRIQWAFWPPDTPAPPEQAGNGIWIPHAVEDDQFDYGDSDHGDETNTSDEESESSSDADEWLTLAEVEEEDFADPEVGSRFDALTIDSGDEEEEEEDGDVESGNEATDK